MMKTRGFLLTMLSALPLLTGAAEPSCSGGGTTDGSPNQPAPAQLPVVECWGDGTFIGAGYAVQGELLYSCEVQMMGYGCECPVPGQTAGAYLVVPPDSIAPDVAANICWSNAVSATITYDENLYFLLMDCTPLGSYVAPPPPPFDGDDAGTPG